MHEARDGLRGFALADADLRSFDAQFQARCRLQQPDRYRLIEALPRDAKRIADTIERRTQEAEAIGKAKRSSPRLSAAGVEPSPGP